MPVHYFEMKDAEALRPCTSTKAVALREILPADGSVNRHYYLNVGRDWQWRDRAGWTLEEWQEAASAIGIVTLELQHEDRGIGYSEIRAQGHDIEILNFGLIPDSVGQGLGGPALVAVVSYCWDTLQAERVWLHTCDRDHPNAINNYKRRGFEWFKTEED